MLILVTIRLQPPYILTPPSYMPTPPPYIPTPPPYHDTQFGWNNGLLLLHEEQQERNEPREAPCLLCLPTRCMEAVKTNVDQMRNLTEN